MGMEKKVTDMMMPFWYYKRSCQAELTENLCFVKKAEYASDSHKRPIEGSIISFPNIVQMCSISCTKSADKICLSLQQFISGILRSDSREGENWISDQNWSSQ